jgi:CBS domain containing-hemolysin-like protein
VGEITDEYDVEAPEVDWAPDGTATVPGSVPVDEINERLHLELPEDEEYDSIGGLVLHQLGRVPSAGEAVEADGVRLVVESMQGNRIEKVRIEHASNRAAS